MRTKSLSFPISLHS